MSRYFSRIEAKRLIRQFNEGLSELKKGSEGPTRYKEDVENALNALIAQEVINILKEIPVEELNRDKSGLRIKNLRDAGYNTVADVATANVYALASVYGISSDAAYTIKRIADSYTSKARKDIKIRLSVDSKNARNTALVSSLFKFMNSRTLANEADELLHSYSQRIENLIEDLEPSTGAFKWLFSSSRTKQNAEEAYDMLSRMLQGEYGKRIDNFVLLTRRNDAVEEAAAWNDFKDNSIKYFTTLDNSFPGILNNSEDVYGLPEDLAREIQDECFFPEGLLCELRGYQELGVKYILHQGRVLLGDEMGLGKTIQAIATMVSLKNTGATHFIVVCPASVITNWCREIRKHSLLSVTKVHGQGRKYALNAWIRTGGVAVTTYETTGYFKLEEDFQFSTLVVDEAHYIKNPSATRSKNVRNIAQHAERLLLMTGTALENKVDEMIELINVLRPNIASEIRGKAFMATAPQFRESVAPVYYRRKRDQVLHELPELIESIEWCSLTPQEEEVYVSSVLSKKFMDMRRVSWNVDDLEHSSKARRLLEIIEDAKEDERKVIVFSFFLDTIRAVYKLLGSACVNPINGSLTPQRRQEIIDEFDAAPAGTVLPAQIQSGGTGLNIQSASVVIICEPQLKPSIENQAISRAYRMGQTRNVLVYKLLCEDTVDEHLLSILERKQEEFDAFADKSVAAAANEGFEIDEKTIGQIIQAEIDRINEKNKTK